MNILDLLMPNPASTFFMRLEEDVPAWDFLEGDILVLDRSLEAAEGNLVVAVQDGELVLRVIAREGRHKMLKRPDGETYRKVEAEIWGTVRATVRLL